MVQKTWGVKSQSIYLRSTGWKLPVVQCAARVLILAVGCAWNGCTVDATELERHRVVADTGGFSLRVIISRASTMQHELFQVSRQGNAGYSGGMAAVNGEVTFQQELPETVAIQFREFMGRCPWVQGKPSDCGPDKAEPVTTVTVRLPSGIERVFTLRGEQPLVDEFVQLIRPLFVNRHERLLNKLPEGSEPPKPKAQSTP